MRVIGRDNQAKHGFSTFPAFLEELVSNLSEEALQAVIPDAVLKNIRHVVITGNGDSYAASLATKEFNSKMFRGCDYQVLRCIDVSRHHVFDEINPEQTLVMVISVSGGGARVGEAMQRAAAKGCTTLAITGNPQSRMAGFAKYILPIQIPKAQDFAPSYQARTYVAAICTTILFGIHAGLLRETLTHDKALEIRQELLRYVNSVYCPQVMDRVDDQMYALAQDWKDYLGFDFVGGGSDFATAYFGAAKFFELCGSLNCLNDSEDWCHIDYFQTKRNQLGNMAVASQNCASFSRTVETIGSMSKSDRNVLVVTDASKDLFPENVTVCTLPKSEYEFINPIANFLPLFMLGNYICLARGYEYFGGMGASNPLFSQEGGINTIKSSKIELID